MADFDNQSVTMLDGVVAAAGQSDGLHTNQNVIQKLVIHVTTTGGAPVVNLQAWDIAAEGWYTIDTGNPVAATPVDFAVNNHGWVKLRLSYSNNTAAISAVASWQIR